MKMSFVRKLSINCLCLLGISWGSLPLRSEVISLNQNWLFQRLERGQQAGKIHNQGSDWSSQYNVEHTRVAGVLAVPVDTLRRGIYLFTTGKLGKGKFAS